jgi:hypothetical protein
MKACANGLTVMLSPSASLRVNSAKILLLAGLQCRSSPRRVSLGHDGRNAPLLLDFRAQGGADASLAGPAAPRCFAPLSMTGYRVAHGFRIASLAGVWDPV